MAADLTLNAPDALGPAYERALPRAERRRRGVFYTPPEVADGLVRLARGGPAATRRVAAGLGPLVCDPSAGGGAFLLAAARWLAGLGFDRRQVVADLLWGADVDEDAVAVARAALRTWAAEDGSPAEPRHVVVGDPLRLGLDTWPGAPFTGFDVVVGNPPFLNQLGRSTARRAADVAHLRDRLGDVVTPYVDTAALFLVEAAHLAAPGGRVALVLPESVLSARDAGPARAEALAHAALVGCWVGEERIFDAGVDVCAPVLERGARPRRTVPRWTGRDVEQTSDASVDPRSMATGGTWAAVLGPSAVERGSDAWTAGRGTLATIATATAGFRDQFYGVAPFVSEAPKNRGAGAAPLVTAGAIDPLHPRWGAAPVRFAGRRWDAPVVDLARLGRDRPDLARWGRERLVPKVVLATQTRVLEPVVDVAGTWWPSVPVIAVTPIAPEDPGAAVTSRLWEIASVLLAPPVVAMALDRYRGSALSRDAVKLSAAQVLDVPLPVDVESWRVGAASAERAQAAAGASDAASWREHLLEVGRAMTEAYRADSSTYDWWVDRLPSWR